MKNITITRDNMSELTENAFMDCLFKENENTTNYVPVQGIINNFALHPQRLEEKRNLITALLNELPVEFKSGYSFMNLCTTKNNEQWTDKQKICEQLVVMAIGLNLMEYCAPRAMWTILPGGMPYIVIK